MPLRLAHKPCKVILLVSLWGLLLGGLAQAAPIDKYTGQRIARIDFTSGDPIATENLSKALSIAPGQPLDVAELRKSIVALFETREFAQIEADAENRAEGLVLTFKLRPNFFFADFRLGGDAVIRSPLSSLTQLPLGELYSPKAVDGLLLKVLQALRDNGYYQAVVTSNVQFLSKTRLVTVEYVVQAGPHAAISEITISGSPLLEKQEILDDMKLRPGDFFDSEALKRDFERLRKFYSERGFLNASIRLGKVNYLQPRNAVEIEIAIDSGSFVYIELTGGKIPKKQLRALVPIYEEGSIDLDLIEEGRRNLEDYFQRQGYFDVHVGQEFIEVPSENAYQINYSIDRGKRQRVVSMQFNGAQYFSENQLRAVLATRVGRLTNKGKFSRDLLNQDAESLKNLYLREGFEQVVIQPSFQKDDSGTNIATSFAINEGPRTYVATLEAIGNEELSREVLFSGLNLSAGRPFAQALLEEDRRLVESRYQDRGFTEAKVESAAKRLSGDKVRIEYTIHEGQQIKVDDIHVVGSRQTKRKIITRNINFHEGDPLSQDQLLSSQQKLYGLGLFNRVDVVPVNVNQSDNSKPVIIRVEDGSPIILGYGAGYQDREGPRGTIEISHNNLWGLARSISFRTRASFREQRGQITYKEPRLFNHDLDSFVTLFAEHTHKVSFDTRGINASLQVLKKFRQVDNYLIRYNFETVDLSDVRVNPRATGLTNEGTLKLSTFSTAWLRDTRDDPFEPSKGFFNTANFSVASKLYGSQANILSFFGQTQAHRRIIENTVLATSLRVGLARPFGSTIEVPISERFFAGGSTTLRGFDLDLAGPLDPQNRTPLPLGGNALIVANLELRLPVTVGVSFVPFYDTGNVFSKISDIKFSSFSNTLGFGFRYKTPFGPLRLDVGFNLSPPAGLPTRQIFFTIGNPF